MSIAKRMSVVLSIGFLTVLSGCLMFYTGSVDGPTSVVAVRNEAGRPQEAILQVGGRANWSVVVGPDGPGETYFNSLRYYFASGGKTNSISHATKWAFDDEEIEDVVPIRGTDRWMLAYAEITSGDTVTLDIRLFTPQRLIAQHEITEVLRDGKNDNLRGYGVGYISKDGHTITIPTTDGDCVLDGMTGELTRPKPSPDRISAARTIQAPVGISLYDLATDRILWTVPDDAVLLSRSDTNAFITCASEGTRHTLRLRDGKGAELSRCEVVCEFRDEMAPSPNLKRVAYMVERNGGKLAASFDATRDAALRISTIGGESVTFNVGIGRRLEFKWVTDETIIGTWQKKHDDYDHYEFVVIDALTGKGHVLPFDTDYYRGFDVDVATGCAYLRGRGRDEAYVYDARQDMVKAGIDFSSSAWPQDPKGFVFAGVDNGVGMVFAGMRNWVRVGWDGKIVDSGSLSRKGIVSVGHTLGHGRLAISLKGYAPAVLSLRDGSIIKGCPCLPSAEGRLLVCFARRNNDHDARN